MASPRWAGEKRNAALAAVNTVLPDIVGPAKRMGLPVSVESTKDLRVHIVTVELPGSKPLILALYATTEESRPITWSRLGPRLERLEKHRGRWAPPGGDTLYFVLAASPRTRVTGPARRMLAKRKVLFLTPRKLRLWFNRYFNRRLAGLIKKLRAKKAKAYDKLAELLRVLYLLASRLGPIDVTLHEVEAMVRA